VSDDVVALEVSAGVTDPDEQRSVLRMGQRVHLGEVLGRRHVAA
jgi:hypothetical protein